MAAKLHLQDYRQSWFIQTRALSIKPTITYALAVIACRLITECTCTNRLSICQSTVQQASMMCMTRLTILTCLQSGEVAHKTVQVAAKLV